MNFTAIWKFVPAEVLVFLLQRPALRALALREAKAQFYDYFVTSNEEKLPQGLQEIRYKLIINLLGTIDRAFSEERISETVCRSLIGNLVGQTIMGEKERLERLGFIPPTFLTISPTQKCNLQCKGCYAASSEGSSSTLNFDHFDRIISEARDLWDTHFTVISGGEPLLYRDGKKGLFDILEKHRDNYFMMYTNGTLITPEVASRMAELGNITPAVSIEGFEKETDDRRGRGTFKMVERAMENLRNAGVPFGVSITATRENARLVLSDELIQHYFEERGAFYGWVFQYMPIGRSYTLDLMITPDQRLELFHREQEVVNNRGLFLVDFWNGGPYSTGCISAGRRYFYIDWNGNIAPCVFFPYYLENVYSLYREGKTLNDIFFSPFFKSIREWQEEYGSVKSPDNLGNFITPCLIRDHYDEAYEIMKRFQVKPMDIHAENAFRDPDYRRKMSEYGKVVKSMTQAIWENEFIRVKRGSLGK